MVQKLKMIGIGVAVLLVIIVVLQNTDSVQTKILFLTLEMPRAALLFITALIGFAAGVLTAGRIVIARRKPAEAKKEDAEK